MNVLARCAAVVVCLGQFSLLAAPRWPDAPTPEVAEPVLRLGTPREVSVIVEFTAPPRLESRSRAAAETLESLFAQLSTDIDRIERGTGRVAANAAGSPIRFQYRMAFAGASVRVTREALPAIRALSYVRAVHDDSTFEAYLDRSVPHIGVPQVWERHGLKGHRIVIAIIDTGVDYTHWALGKGFGPGRRVVGGYDFYNDDADPMDDNGHGTHVAGIAAGSPPLKGIAPAATLLAYKVLGKDGSGPLSAILAAVDRAMDPDGNGDSSDRADVVNMSLGGPLSRNDALIAAVERSTAAGTVFCLAAGNSFAHGSIGSPGAAPSAITVGASDLQDQPKDFTSHGPIGGSWLVKPEIAAPGFEIASAVPGGTTRIASGTSMAAPHVAGVAALVLARHPGWSPADVKAAIVSTAKPVLDFTTGSPLPSITSSGAGRIDALRAVETTLLPAPSTITFGHLPKRGQPHSSSVKVRFENRGASSEKLTVRTPPLPGGVTITATPAIVTVEPGATAEIQFTLGMTAGAPPPNEGDVVFAGILEVAGAASVMRLPWQIMNGDAVSVTYTGTDDFQPYVSRGMSPAVMWWEGPRTFGAFVLKTRKADLLVLSDSPDEQGRLIIRERVLVEGHTAVTITPEEAVHRITLAGVTESGVPLSSLGDGRKAWHYLWLPSLSYITVEYPERRRSLLVSSLENTQIRSYENAFDGAERYFGAYRNLVGVKQSETLSIVPADWASQKVRLHCRTDCTILAASGGGSALGWDYDALPASENEWNVHITPQVLPEVDFRMHFMVKEKDLPTGDYFNRANPWSFLSPSIRNTNGRIAASTFNRATHGDYMAPDRDTPMDFGDGPVVLRMTMGSRRVDLRPYGSLGENLGQNAWQIDAELTKADGSKVSMTRDLFIGTYEFQPPPDIYRFTATDTYPVNGKTGKLTQVSRYDTRLYDAPPGLSLLRIETGRGLSASGVLQHSQPRLVFGARTSLFVPPNNFYVMHTPTGSGSKAWWRRHGTSEWQPLAVTITSEDNGTSSDQPGMPGTIFAGPLDAATAEPGEIDLKILVVNEYGATTEAVYEPAFVVTPAVGRRRSARH